MSPEVEKILEALFSAGVRPAQADSVTTALGFTPGRPVRVRPMPQGILGGFTAGTGEIQLNRDYPARLPDVLMHEMTHEALERRRTDSDVPSDFVSLLDRLLAQFQAAPRDVQNQQIVDYYGPSDTTGVIADRIGWAGYSSPAAGEIAGRTMQRGFAHARAGTTPGPDALPGTAEAFRFLTNRFPRGAEARR